MNATVSSCTPDFTSVPWLWVPWRRSPRDAVEYALGRGVVALYALILAGYVSVLVGSWFGWNWAVRGGGAGTVGQLLAAIFVLGGFLAILGGLIALAYKVIADANDVART